MKLENSEIQAAADLKALAAAAHGSPLSQHVSQPVTSDREARVAELRARYKAGELTVDEKALAAKIVDHLLEAGPDNFESKG